MKKKDFEKVLEKLILTDLVSTTVFIAPFSVTHPYSVPKLIPLISFSLPLVAIIVSIVSINRSIIKNYKLILILIISHALISILVVLVGKNNRMQELYGVWGRNNGFLTHFSYLVLFTATIFLSIKRSLINFIRISIITGWVTLAYGLMQYFKLVRIASINGGNTQSTGFFGNENFYSSFIGIISVISLSMAIGVKNNALGKAIYYIFPILGLIGIYLANSQQGYLVFAVGISISIFMFLKTSKNKLIASTFIITSTTGLLLIVLGFFQFGPFSKFVYEKSISFRGYYWRTGLEIFFNNPILGVGFDSYRDWYRRFRSQDALQVLGATDIADSAHNYFIDIAVNGGTLLLLTYLFIIFYIIICTIKILKSMQHFYAAQVAVIGAWYAFMVQTFISLPQPGLTIWGWILSGLIVAISKQNSIDVPKLENKVLTKTSFGIAVILFIFGLVISISPFRVSHEYRNAVETQNVSKLIHSAEMLPKDATMCSASGGALIGVEYFVEAKKILSTCIKEFPQYYESWYIYSLLPNITSEEKNLANSKMVFLEPLLKASLDIK